MRQSIPAAILLSLVRPAVAQQFTNRTFDSGLSGWTIVNTSNGTGSPGTISTVDIDGAGPLTPSTAATFRAGQLSNLPGAQEGVVMTQRLTLAAGSSYSIAFDWLATNGFVSSNSECGVFTIIVNASPLASAAAGALEGLASAHGHLTATFAAPTAGDYDIGIRITRPYIAATLISQYVDNASLAPAAPACYANCDGSSAPPILNANDFQCFLARYAQNDAYANCDHSSSAAVLNANDFQCFLNKFATNDPYANCDGSTIAPVLNANDFQCFLNRFVANDAYANCDGSSSASVFNANDFQCFLNAFAVGCS